jgi:hypothetical protein
VQGHAVTGDIIDVLAGIGAWAVLAALILLAWAAWHRSHPGQSIFRAKGDHHHDR